ncbi:glycosyltransferase [Virgibacillus dakarensis]|nr:glycosyltransferase [Virgibacillus dakarensis]
MALPNLVSIIVPVYNAEKYLSRCISSILNQTHQLIEVILVNDGSTDDSGVICDRYAKWDRRVQVIHQQNAGPSVARNTGIAAASGDYIQFVDGDDCIDSTMTARLVEAMKNEVQLVICGYKMMHRRMTSAIIPSIPGVYTNAAFLKHVGELYKNVLLPSPCNKLYDAAVINDYDIRFDKHFTMGEDLLFNLAYLNVCDRIHIIRDTLYNYCMNHNSLTKVFKEDLMENQQVLIGRVQDFLQRKNCYTGDNHYFLAIIQANGIVNGLNNLFHQHSSLTPRQKKAAIATIISADNVKHAHFSDTLQSQLVGSMIERKSVNGIYLFFAVKNMLHQRLHPLFYLLKRMNLSS